MNEKIDFLAEHYDKLLTVIDMQEDAKISYARVFKLSKKDIYKNPFYHEFDEPLKKIRDACIGSVIEIFNEIYPNVDLEGDDFKTLFSRDRYGNRKFGINWEGLKKKLEHFRKNADELALKNLLYHSWKLLPHGLWKKQFIAEEILKNSRLELHCGYGWSSPNTEHIKYFLALINVILGQAPATAKEYEVEIKYYKNGRVDFKFNNEEKARLVAEYLAKKSGEKYGTQQNSETQKA